MDTGVDVVAGTPRLYAEASVGVAQDQDRFARPGGLNGVVRLQSSIGPWIIGASHIRTRASDAWRGGQGRAEFTGVDVRWMKSGVQLRGEWIDGRPADGQRTFGGYLDAIVHRPAMGPVTAVARAERLDYLSGSRWSLFPRRYTLGAKVRLTDHLRQLHQPTNRPST